MFKVLKELERKETETNCIYVIYKKNKILCQAIYIHVDIIVFFCNV